MARITGGEKAQKAIADIVARAGKAKLLAVGFLEKASYPDGTPVALVALIQDFGAPGAGIPPRPFFRNMVAAKSPAWPKQLAGLLKTNRYDVDKSLAQMGEGIKGQLQQSILDTWTPPLAPSTVRRKGFDKPLIDTSHMLNSVAYEVK